MDTNGSSLAQESHRIGSGCRWTLILTLICCLCVRCFWCLHPAVVFAHWQGLSALSVAASAKGGSLPANTCTSTRDWYQQAWCPLVGWIELQAWCPQLNPAPCCSHGLSCRHCRSRLNTASWAVRCHEAMLPVVCSSLDTITTMVWSDFPNICMNIAKTKKITTAQSSSSSKAFKKLRKVTKELRKVSLSQQISKQSQSEL